MSQIRVSDENPGREIRAADADRERIAERLREAAVEGRLSPEELERRLETALAAPTYADLEGVVADLPQPRPPSPPRRRPELGAFVATLVLLLAEWSMAGIGYFWPLWPILGWGVFVVPDALAGARVRACRRSA